MVACEEIRLDYKKAKYRVWNKEKKKWFYFVEQNSSLPLSQFLIDTSGDDIYFAISLKKCPQIWGKSERIK